MISREDVLCQITEELDDMLAAAPERLPAADLLAIKEEAIGDTRRVLDALSARELQSPLALERFIETTLAQARLSMHMR